MPDIPGITAKHVVIDDQCRATRTDGGAFNKAVMQLLAEYSLVTELRKDEEGLNYHFVFTVEDTKKPLPEACSKCGQTDEGQQGEYPCPKCGLPTLHGEPTPAASDASHCCHLECDKPAEWVIVSGPAPDDYTEVCTAHVGELLCDAKEQHVYPITMKATEKKPASPFDGGVVGCGM